MKNFLDELVTWILVAALIVGIPFVILSWIFDTMACQGGNGPDVSRCM
jgi:hypothetical protein